MKGETFGSTMVWPPGESEMARRIREHDWAQTPLGPIEGWPQSLRVVVQLMLGSEVIMVAPWGEDAILIYNDAYSRLIGPRNSMALGHPAFEILPELRPVLEPQFAEVKAGNSVTVLDQFYPFVQATVLEDAWFDVSHNPIRGENGEVAGLLTILIETTGRVEAERRRDAAEAAVRESEGRFRGFFENAAVGAAQIDRSGRFTYVNDKYCEITGYSREDLVGHMRPLDLDHPEEVEQDRERLADFFSGKLLLYECEKRYVRKDGRVIWVRVCVSAIRDERGSIEATAAAIEDITERRRAEEASRESEQRFRSLVALSSDWYWEQDDNFRFVRFSDEVVNLAGSSASSHYGKTRWELPSVGVTDEQWADHRAILERHEPFRNFEFRRVNERGEIVWLSSSGDPVFDEDGRFKGYRGTGHNITERKRVEASLRESEERLRLALDATSAGVWSWDAITNASTWDDRYHELYGFTSADPISFETWFERIHPDDRPRIKNRIDRIVQPSGDDIWQEEFRALHPARGERWMMGTGRAKRDQVGNCLGVAGINLDITERKKAESVLRDSEERLSQLNRGLEARVAERTHQLEHEMKLREQTQAALAQSQRMEALGQLTGGIAHDFNNLLGVISGSLELAELHNTNPRVSEPLRQAVDAIQLAAGLNRRLLSLGRRSKPSRQQTALNARVQELLPMLQRSLGGTIEISSDLSPDLWITIADASEVDSAILNLAINARDAMPDGGKLTIVTRNITLEPQALKEELDARPGDYVCLEIADTGCGMSPDVLARATEPFFTTKDVGKGSGLGLSSVFGFCAQAGGFLSILSAPGEGTCVRVHLPRTDTAARSIGDVLRSKEVPRGDGELILVVDDNKQVREVAVNLLDDLDYTVIEVSSGNAALEALKSEELVALVFSDVVMPGGVSGRDVAHWVKANRPDVRVLLTTGFDDPTIADESADDLSILAKPYTREQLARAVRAALQAGVC